MTREELDLERAASRERMAKRTKDEVMQDYLQRRQKQKYQFVCGAPWTRIAREAGDEYGSV